MLPFSLFLIGAALSVYCLWQLRRWLEQADGAAAEGSRRLGDLVDELVTTAESTVSVVAEKSEELGAAIVRADERLARLEATVQAVAVVPAPLSASPATTPAPASAPTPAPTPAPAPAGRTGLSGAQRELYSKVYALADAGHDVTGIARTMDIGKGEVQVIMGLRPAVRGGA